VANHHALGLRRRAGRVLPHMAERKERRVNTTCLPVQEGPRPQALHVIYERTRRPADA
jgi:hypothetical protein